MVFHDKTFFNRELSWLRFNHRVLQEAGDLRNPVYERLKFLAIFSSNLDEFFEVRVSNIRRIKQLDKPLRKKLITKPNKLLRTIKKEVLAQQEEFGEILKNQIIPDLKKEGIFLLEQNEFTTSQKEFARQYFDEHLKHQLSLKIDSEQIAKKKLFIEKEALYLVSVIDLDKLIWVKIPIDTPRFVEMPSKNGKHLITFVDDIINYGLSEYYNLTFYSVKISRDAELYIGNEYSGNLLEKIKNSLSKRETGQVTRALVDTNMPESIVKKISQFLDINETDLVSGGRYHNLKDFFGFPNPSDKMLSLEKLPPKKQSILAEAKSLFSVIKEKDQLLYFPYESFDEVIRFVEEAATDKNVTKIKMTLYRVSKNSAIAKALLIAVQNGKEVVVFIETKARFDEANNIKWGKKLEEAGAKVIYSYPGIKVHSKIMYVERTEQNKTQGYGYVGTGNFNESTSLIYTDLAVMTAHPKITSELSQIFKVLEGKIIIPNTKKLLVSPFSARSSFIKLVNKEIKLAKAGKPAHILLKMNSLQDKDMIDLLYKASNAGVKVRLIIRGICCLVAGVKGQSENIYATSVVDRFLEHARVYIFGNGGKTKMYIGSADWMTRNLDHRIEVMLPILDADIFDRIMNSLQLQLDDDVKARILDVEQKNEYVVSSTNQQSSQHLTYHSL